MKDDMRNNLFCFRKLLMAGAFLVMFMPLWLIPNDGLAQTQDTSNWVTAVAWNPDGTQVAVSHNTGLIQVFDNRTNAISFSVQGHNSAVFSLAWSPDGNLLASGGITPDNTLRVWDVANGNQTLEYAGFGIDILTLAWSPDGNQVLAVTAEGVTNQGNAIVLNPLTGEATPLSLGTVSDMQWSPDGTQIAMSTPNSLEIRDASNFQSRFNIPIDREVFRQGLQNQLVTLAWSPDGAYIAGGTGDGRVFLWNVETQATLFTLIGNDYQGDDRFIGWVHALRFDGSSQTLTSVSGDGTIRSWNVETGMLVAEQVGNANYAADFSPQGVRVALGVAPVNALRSLSLSAEPMQLADVGISVLVLNPTIAGLEELSGQCDIPATMTETLVQMAQETNAEAIESMVAEVADMTSVACEADLRALLEAIQSQ